MSVVERSRLHGNGLPRNPFRRLRLRALIASGLRSMESSLAAELRLMEWFHVWSPLAVSARRWRQRRNLRNRLRSESTGRLPDGLLTQPVPQTSSAGTHCKRTPAFPSTRGSGRSRDRSNDDRPQMEATPESAEPRAFGVDSEGLTSTRGSRRSGDRSNTTPPLFTRPEHWIHTTQAPS